MRKALFLFFVASSLFLAGNVQAAIYRADRDNYRYSTGRPSYSDDRYGDLEYRENFYDDDIDNLRPYYRRTRGVRYYNRDEDNDRAYRYHYMDPRKRRYDRYRNRTYLRNRYYDTVDPYYYNYEDHDPYHKYDIGNEGQYQRNIRNRFYSDYLSDNRLEDQRRDDHYRYNDERMDQDAGDISYESEENDLGIAYDMTSDPQAESGHYSDRKLLEKIRSKLENNGDSKKYKDIQVHVSNGVVNLDGNVDNDSTRRELINKVRRIDGVNEVNDNLRLKKETVKE